MEWMSANNLCQFIELGDTIEFRTWGFGFLRRKRWARVIRFNGNKNLPLTEQIYVVEIRNPITTKFNPEQEQSLAELMKGKVGHLYNKQKETQKSGICQKIVSFFSRILDRIQDLFHTIEAKIENFHENILSKWGYNLRRVGYHILMFVFEAFIGISIVLMIVTICCVIFLFFALLFSSIFAIVSPGVPFMFPLSLLF